MERLSGPSTGECFLVPSSTYRVRVSLRGEGDTELHAALFAHVEDACGERGLLFAHGRIRQYSP